MSSPITSTATHLPAQLLEVASALQSAELAIDEANRPDNISITTDIEALTVTVTATLPVTFAGSANDMTLTSSDYLA